MVEEPHKMAKALHILTEAPLEKTFHHLRQFWLSIPMREKTGTGLQVWLQISI
jgi:hypothetical protein